MASPEPSQQPLRKADEIKKEEVLSKAHDEFDKCLICVDNKATICKKCHDEEVEERSSLTLKEVEKVIDRRLFIPRIRQLKKSLKEFILNKETRFILETKLIEAKCERKWFKEEIEKELKQKLSKIKEMRK